MEALSCLPRDGEAALLGDLSGSIFKDYFPVPSGRDVRGSEERWGNRVEFRSQCHSLYLLLWCDNGGV